MTGGVGYCILVSLNIMNAATHCGNTYSTYRQNLWVSFRKISPFLQRVMLVNCSQNLMLRKAREESYM